MRRTTSLTALLLGATLLAPTTQATAAGETCRGEAATIVGSFAATVVGTDGRDVIVTAEAMSVNAGAGDDLICVTGSRTADGSGTIRIDAGAGNDVVDGTGAPEIGVLGVLGAGADEFQGGPHNDAIGTGAPDSASDQADAERDVVATGAGDDSVTTGDDGAPNEDVVDLGVGDDSASWFGAAATDAVSVTAGDGSDRLLFHLTPGDWLIRNPSGQAWRDGSSVVRWSSVERFYLNRTEHVAGRVDYFGTHAGDEVEVYAARPELVRGALNVGFGSGDDTLKVDGVTDTGSLWAGGPGDNRLVVGTTEPSLWLDLRDDSLDFGETRGTRREAEVHRFDDVHVMARKVWVRGTMDDDEIHTTACQHRVWGDDGNDVIERDFDHPFLETYTFDCTERAWFVGGRGKDRLRGSLGPDRLVGGGGNDTLIGRKGRDLGVGGTGRDRCRTEIRKSCET